MVGERNLTNTINESDQYYHPWLRIYLQNVFNENKELHQYIINSVFLTRNILQHIVKQVYNIYIMVELCHIILQLLDRV